MTSLTDTSIEDLVLVHRYLYYVLGTPVISDSIYDAFERQAREVLPETSVVHQIGSSNPWDYSEKIKEFSSILLKDTNAGIN